VGNSVEHTGRAAGGESAATVRIGGRRVLPARQRRKRQAIGLAGSSCQGAAQVVFGVGVTAREAGASESQHGLDLVRRYATTQQRPGDPQVGDTPIGRRETLGNVQSVQPTGIDPDSGGRCEGAAQGTRWRRKLDGWRGWREAARSGLQQRGGMGSEVGFSVPEFDPGSVTAKLAPRGFVIGEPSQPSQVMPIGAGAVCAVEMSQVSGDGGSHGRLERSQTDTNPGLQMAGAGAQHDTRLMPIGAHGIDDVVIGAVQIDQNVTSVPVAFKGVEEHVVSFAITQPQKSNHGVARQLRGGPNKLSRKRPSAAAMNQTHLIIIARHGGQLSAHGLQRDEESAIHDRDSNIGSGSPFLKPELLTLQKTGTSHFALTFELGLLTLPCKWHNISAKEAQEVCSVCHLCVRSRRWSVRES